MPRIDKHISIPIILLLVFLSIIALLKIFEQTVMKDGFSKRQPLKNYKYISDEINKLPEGENIYLSGVYRQGQLNFHFKYNDKISNEDLIKLSNELYIIIDKYLIANEWNTKVGVVIFYNDLTLCAFERREKHRNSEDYYWWIDGKEYPIYTGE